jgi:hypothetical protein
MKCSMRAFFISFLHSFSKNKAQFILGISTHTNILILSWQIRGQNIKAVLLPLLSIQVRFLFFHNIPLYSIWLIHRPFEKGVDILGH